MDRRAYFAPVAVIWTLIAHPVTLSADDGGHDVQPARVLANDNRRPAGTLANGSLVLKLRAGAGLWRPEGAAGPALTVEALGEDSGPLQVPAPLIRIPEGTEVLADIRNDLDLELQVHGLCTHDGSPCPAVELDSYYDGVHGWSGAGSQVTPLIDARPPARIRTLRARSCRRTAAQSFGRHYTFEQLLSALRAPVASNRMLATILCAASADRSSAASSIERIQATVAGNAPRFGGTAVQQAGERLFAVFDGPARAIRCACAITADARAAAIPLMVGLHTGECDLAAGTASGLVADIGARVAALGNQGDVLVSRTVVDLVAGSGLRASRIVARTNSPMGCTNGACSRSSRILLLMIAERGSSCCSHERCGVCCLACSW
jgi:hypothetical protein